MKTNKTPIFITLCVVMGVVFAVSGCAEKEIITPCLKGHTYGFWGGLWHGFIAPIQFIGMLLGKNITMYAQNNNGGWYAFGFLIGSGGWGFLSGRGSRRR